MEASADKAPGSASLGDWRLSLGERREVEGSRKEGGHMPSFPGLPPEPPVSELVDTGSRKAGTPRLADGGGLGLGGRPS
jgi:hypothetical protein